jgi:prepilin-type N-terminal cleavage/methylation domain-containing protein
MRNRGDAAMNGTTDSTFSTQYFVLSTTLSATPHFALRTPHLLRRRGFTLMELLIVIMILAIIAGMSMMALAGAAEQAREQRTRAIITKIDSLIIERWNSYRFRAVPIRVAVNSNPRFAATARLNALRELMRMELPDRITDVTAPPTVLTNPPSVRRAYLRRATTGWTTQHQGSECLYLILSTMKDGDKNALDFFTDTEIGDIDEDGMKEILDGWGTPIEFLRWAPGFVTELGATTLQTNAYGLSPDPFDPIKIDPRWPPSGNTGTYALRPLIFSAGKDKAYDIGTALTNPNGGGQFIYSTTTPPNDPYYVPTNGESALGTPFDANANSTLEWADNITNHYQAPQ